MPLFSRACLAFASALVLLSAVPVYAADASVEIPVAAQNGSNEAGVAILTPTGDKGDKTIVEVKLTGGPAGPQPAHFHTGTCDKYAPRPLYPLSAVHDGKSTTTLDVPMSRLLQGDLVLNVHKSLDDIATIAACGLAKAK